MATKENQEKKNSNESNGFEFETTDMASRGIVSSLTGLVNSVTSVLLFTKEETREEEKVEAATTTTTTRLKNNNNNPPTSPQELCLRLEKDYTVNNYLWTGQLDLDCFQADCRFTDPTLSFQGIDTFRTNTQNLVPLVEKYCFDTSSTLLEIQLTEDYVETRWNMVGSLKLFWNPQINVIGRTKFWYTTLQKNNDDNDVGIVQVYKYDEKWEIPPYQALLQLLTPAGTFPNTTKSTTMY